MAKLSRPYDNITNEYVERELQKLQAEQEMLRQSKGMGGPTDEIPTTGFSGQFGPAEFKHGGKKHWIQDAVNPAHKGYCTPMTKATCTPKRKAFAMTMKKHHGFHADGGYKDQPYLAQHDLLGLGGSLNTYELGAGGYKKYLHAGDDETSFLVKPKSMLAWEDETPVYNIPQIQPTVVDNRYNAPIGSDTVKYLPEVKAPIMGTSGGEPAPKKFDWASLGTNVAQLAPGISETLMGLVNKDDRYTNFPNAPTNLVNYNQAATDITNQSGLMEQSAAQALGKLGQSPGAYLNSRINLASRLGQQTGAQLAELRMNEANTNAQIKNKIGLDNIMQVMARENAKAQNRAARESAITAGLAKIGQTTGGIGQDKNKAIADKKQLQYILDNWDTLFPAANKPKLG